MNSSRYPSPGPTGGLLLRKLNATLRQLGFALPLTQEVHIGFSGGLDSTALALLLARYGRRIAPKSHLHLHFVQHQWSSDFSPKAEDSARAFAEGHELPLTLHRVEPPPNGVSWEGFARSQREAVFQQILNPTHRLLFTAHQLDDLVETLIWRFCTANQEAHPFGILPVDGRKVRPLLTTSRESLRTFLQEEGQEFQIDPSNSDPRFLRGNLRATVLPILREVFPHLEESLAQEWWRKVSQLNWMPSLAAKSDEEPVIPKGDFQRSPEKDPSLVELAALALEQERVVLRKNQRRDFEKKLASGAGKIEFTNGWSLERISSTEWRLRRAL